MFILFAIFVLISMYTVFQVNKNLPFIENINLVSKYLLGECGGGFSRLDKYRGHGH